MKVTLLQTDIHWAKPEDNIRDVQRLMTEHAGSDLYVLPEMWSTGFATEPEGIAVNERENVALEWMKQTARENQCAICGSLAVRLDDGTYRNRHYFADGRRDTISYYDKHHLFTHGHENRYYTAGKNRKIVEYNGFHLLLLTCYDLRFPCWSRFSSENAFDAIVVVANWPESRQHAWEILTQARAIENQCFLIGVNRVGDDLYSHYAGRSCVVDCYGDVLGQCESNVVQVLTMDLDLAELQRRRSRFRVLDDRDLL